MRAIDAYSILYLLNLEIRKSSKALSLGNVFSPIAWQVAQDKLDASLAFGRKKEIDEIGTSKCISIANAIECSQTNMETLEVYFVGEYIRRNRGEFYKRKKDGSILMRKSKKTGKEKVIYNPIDIDSLGRLDGIDFYKPENLRSQIDSIKEESNKRATLLIPDPVTKKNTLYEMLISGRIGLHVYLHLFKKNSVFGIVIEDRSLDEEYRRFLKMASWLSNDFDLDKIYFRNRAN